MPELGKEVQTIVLVLNFIDSKLSVCWVSAFRSVCIFLSLNCCLFITNMQRQRHPFHCGLMWYLAQ